MDDIEASQYILDLGFDPAIAGVVGFLKRDGKHMICNQLMHGLDTIVPTPWTFKQACRALEKHNDRLRRCIEMLRTGSDAITEDELLDPLIPAIAQNIGAANGLQEQLAEARESIKAFKDERDALWDSRAELIRERCDSRMEAYEECMATWEYLSKMGKEDEAKVALTCANRIKAKMDGNS